MIIIKLIYRILRKKLHIIFIFSPVAANLVFLISNFASLREEGLVKADRQFKS